MRNAQARSSSTSHGPRVPAAQHARSGGDRRGDPVPARATSSKHGEAAEEERRGCGGSGGGAGSRLARHREPEGSGTVNHLLREHAPITEAGWNELDEEARERLDAGLAARKLVDFAGPHGWEYSATNLGRIEPRSTRRRRRRAPRAAACCRSSSCAPTSRVSRAELADLDRGAEDVDLDALDEAAAPDRDGREQRRLPRLARRRHHRHRRGVHARPAIALGDDFDATRARRRGRRDAAARPASRARTALALGPDEYTGVIQTTEHGGYPLFDHLTKILGGGPIVWARACAARSWSACAAATSCSSPARTSRSATTTTTTTRSTSTSRRASASGVATPEAACFLQPAGQDEHAARPPPARRPPPRRERRSDRGMAQPVQGAAVLGVGDDRPSL